MLNDIVFRSDGGNQLLVFILCAIALVLIFWAHHWRKPFWSFLALISKLSALAVLVFLMLKPELRQELQTTREPTLLVLTDSSPSMETQDVANGEDALTRTQASKEFFSSDEWKAFTAQTKMKIEERTFAKGAKETDLSEILEQSKTLNPTSVLLVSDGAWNKGDPPSRVGQEYSLEETPIFSLALGSEKRMPDLEVEVQAAPIIVEVEDPFALQLELRSSFLERVRTKLVVKEGDIVIESQEVVLEPESKQVIDVIHEFSKAGPHDIKVELTPVGGEVIAENNFLETKIEAREIYMKVLLVDSLPRWEYRFIRNAMIRDERVDVDCLLLHPGMAPGSGPNYIQSFPESLAEYDVIFLGDIGEQLTEKNILEIDTAVRVRASGLILMPGSKGWQQPLIDHEVFRKLYPVEFGGALGGIEVSHSEHLKLSNAGEESLLMNLSADPEDNSRLWGALPGFHWYQPTSRLKAGATALAYHQNATGSSGLMPLVVTARSGRGKVLYMGIDSSWRWRRGVEDLYHYRFWRQMSRWMSYQRNLTEGQQVQMFLSTDSLEVGRELGIDLIAMNIDGRPAKSDQVKVMVTHPDGGKKILPLGKKEEWGAFLSRMKPRQQGTHQLEVFVDQSPVAKRSFEVAPAVFETIGEPADLSTLSELAYLTRAVSVTYEDQLDLFEHLEKAANPPKRYQFSPLAHQWWWLVGIIVLLIFSWIFRRLSGAE